MSINRWPEQMGYYSNASKTNLIVKPQFHEVAIKVTTEGHEMLSSTISATSFAGEYTSHKIKDFLWWYNLVA